MLLSAAAGQTRQLTSGTVASGVTGNGDSESSETTPNLSRLSIVRARHARAYRQRPRTQPCQFGQDEQSVVPCAATILAFGIKESRLVQVASQALRTGGCCSAARQHCEAASKAYLL